MEASGRATRMRSDLPDGLAGQEPDVPAGHDPGRRGRAAREGATTRRRSLRARAAGLRRDLLASAVDGAAYGGMLGLGHRYLPAFVLAVGLSEQLSGLVVTAPLVAGALLQLVSPYAVVWLRSHRRWVAGCATVQGLSFLPLVIAALRGHVSAAALLMIATFYCAADLACAAPWTSWITRLVPTRIRPRYFARRNRLFQLVTLGGILMAWPVLELTEQRGATCAGFALLFGLAGICRLVSAGCLWLQRESIVPVAPERFVAFGEFFTRLRNERGQLLAYMVWINVTMLVAQAYFTAFVLRHLHMPYWQFVSLLGTEFLAKIAGLALFGELAHRRGARALLQVAGLAMVPVTALWLMWPQFWYLVAVQVLSGLALGAYELATCLLVFDTIPDRERTSVMTTYNLLNSAAVAAASFGAFVALGYAGATWVVYAGLFVALTLARGLAVPLLARIVRARRPGELAAVGAAPSSAEAIAQARLWRSSR
jgi:hypothetical protein